MQLSYYLLCYYVVADFWRPCVCESLFPERETLGSFNCRWPSGCFLERHWCWVL